MLHVFKKADEEEARSLPDGKIHKMFSLKLLTVFCRSPAAAQAAPTHPRK